MNERYFKDRGILYKVNNRMVSRYSYSSYDNDRIYRHIWVYDSHYSTILYSGWGIDTLFNKESELVEGELNEEIYKLIMLGELEK